MLIQSLTELRKYKIWVYGNFLFQHLKTLRVKWNFNSQKIKQQLHQRLKAKEITCIKMFVPILCLLLFYESSVSSHCLLT